MSRILFTYTLLLISFCLCSSSSMELDSVEKVKIYSSGTNTNDRIKIIEGEYGLSEVFFFRNTDTHWMKATILSIDTIQEYVKVEIISTNEIFELFIEWNNDKMTAVDAEKRKVIYWRI